MDRLREAAFLLSCLAAGDFYVTIHAEMRMRERGVSHKDI